MVGSEVRVQILFFLADELIEICDFSLVSLLSGCASVSLASGLEEDLCQAGTLVLNLGCRGSECQASKCECLEHWEALR